MAFPTLPDLCDEHADVLAVAEPIFRHFGGREQFCGPVRTLRCFEDNSLVADTLREPGEGAVLVVDGGGSRRCALVGDNLAAAAADNNWAGVVVWGCVRDVAELAAIDVGIMALAAHPMRSIKRGVGERDVVVRFAGLTCAPDAYLYADANGWALAPGQLHT